MKLKSLIFIFLVNISLTLSFEQTDSLKSDILVDKRDSNKYNLIKIADQIWMKENMKFNLQGSYCNECEKYGRLYTYEQSIKACPEGWHLPSINEFRILIDFLGGKDEAGNKLKTKEYWLYQNEETDNSSGFSALPAGTYDFAQKTFFSLGYQAMFWTKEKESSDSSKCVILYNLGSIVSFTSDFNLNGLCVRCIKD